MSFLFEIFFDYLKLNYTFLNGFQEKLYLKFDMIFIFKQLKKNEKINNKLFYQQQFSNI